MPITDINRSDDQDNSVSAIGESESTNTARLSLNSAGQYALNTVCDITIGPATKFPIIPSAQAIPFSKTLLNGTAFNMNVNGSGANVNFSFSPLVSEVFYIDSLSMFLSDGSTPRYNEFGDIAALTNGIDIIYRRNSVNYLLANIRNNFQLAFFFNSISLPNSIGFFDNADMFFGTKELRTPLLLNGSTGDYFRIIVKDNLTAIDSMTSSITVLQIV